MTFTLLEADGAGCITRICVALAAPELTDHRDAILRPRPRLKTRGLIAISRTEA